MSVLTRAPLPEAAATRTGTWLVADVGGTRLRLGLARGASDPVPRGAVVLPRAEWPDLASAVEHYLEGVAPRHRPTSACVAVAAPVDGGDEVRLTNADFAFSVTATRERLGLDELLVVNDVEALARSVAALRPGDAEVLVPGGLDRSRTVAVVAPGTGLGVAALLPGDLVVSGEGGQAPLPASVPAALELAPELLAAQGHVSAEDLVCGGALPRLDLALRRRAGEDDPRPRTAAEIASSGETAPGQVLDVLTALLAAVAQSAVLTLGARGGLVLGGGVLPGLVPALRACRFAERFAAHPKVAAYLAAVPVVVDVRPCPALDGAALLLQDRR